jgi:hypothetical protein
VDNVILEKTELPYVGMIPTDELLLLHSGVSKLIMVYTLGYKI